MSDDDLLRDAATDDWYGEHTATFGDRLAGAREAAGLSQGTLADKLGVKAATLARWEDDLAEPRANRLNILSGLLGVSLSWLLTGVGDGPSGPPDAAGADGANGDMRPVLSEMRDLRVTIERSAIRLGHLEKRLRRMIGDAP